MTGDPAAAVGAVVDPIDAERSRFFGACFALFNDQHWVTADHVVEAALERGAEPPHVLVVGRLMPTPAVAIFRHPTLDIAVLRVDEHGADIGPFVDVADAAIGDAVSLIRPSTGVIATTSVTGHFRIAPLSTAATRGTDPLPAGARDMRYRYPAVAIEADDTLGHGFSGSPAWTAAGEVVGVYTARDAYTGFCLQISAALPWLAATIQQQEAACMSANSGDEIYNVVTVEGTAANGEKLSVQRSASQQAGIVPQPVTSPAATNPSFAVDTASWTPSTGTAITRDTAVFDSSPASGRWDRGGGVLAVGDTLTETFTGTFKTGVQYILRISMRPSSAFARGAVKFGGAQNVSVFAPSTAFATYDLPWSPTTDTTTATVVLMATTLGGVGPAVYWYIDSLTVFAAAPTLADRRGFKRTAILPVKNSLTNELAVQIGDVWLAAHKTTPLKGTVRVEGDGAAREIKTGRSVPPEQLLLRTGELLRLSDRIDPDTGGQGRNGRIAEVTYTSVDDVAVVALDSRRTSHEALLARLAVVVGVV